MMIKIKKPCPLKCVETEQICQLTFSTKLILLRFCLLVLPRTITQLWCNLIYFINIFFYFHVFIFSFHFDELGVEFTFQQTFFRHCTCFPVIFKENILVLLYKGKFWLDLSKQISEHVLKRRPCTPTCSLYQREKLDVYDFSFCGQFLAKLSKNKKLRWQHH